MFAQIMLAYCTQASQVIYNITGKHSSNSVDYANIWRMALYNYNVGPNCLYDSISAMFEEHPATGKIEWDEFKKYVPEGGCQIGIGYVDQITTMP
jgi:hypothetical protein